MTVHGPGPVVPPIRPLHVQTIASPPAPSHGTSASVPPAVDVPEGVDTALWQMLTPEEQSFFAQQSTLGPLTYGPGDVPAAAAPRGQRVDVRA